MEHRRNGGIWIGVIFIILGFLLLADNFDILYYISPGQMFHNVRFFSWSFIMFIVGVIILANHSRSVVGWVFVVLGGSHFASKLFRFSFGDFFVDFWPLILIGLGLLLIFRRREHKTLHFEQRCNANNFSRGNFTHSNFSSGNFAPGADSAATGGESTSDEIDIVSIFNSVKRRIITNNFKGGRVTSIFGGSELYLSDSQLAPGEQILDIACVFGGVDVYVPKDWRVIVKTVTIFGGFDDSRFQGGTTNIADDRALVIKGFVLFGGGDIKNG